MPPRTTARRADWAPAHSPVLAPVNLSGATALYFAARGAVQHAPYSPPQYAPPSGAETAGHEGGAEHGLSGIVAPMNSLLGVFLDDERPDRTRAPKGLSARDEAVTEPQLKQIFYIGSGETTKGVRKRFLVPKGATRLFLGVMDGFDWGNNQGSFSVAVAVERADIGSNMSSVESSIAFADWACMPDRAQCTPEHAIVKEVEPGLYHVILPAQLEWGASIPTPAGSALRFRALRGTVCLTPAACSGPGGNKQAAGPDFTVPGAAVGSLVRKTENGRTYFSVNDRPGEFFHKHEGYFEFQVSVTVTP